MKLFGAVFIIFSSFILGVSKRNSQLRCAKIIEQFIRWCEALKDNIEYKSLSLSDFVDRTAVSERYALLDFLPISCQLSDKGKTIREALVNALVNSSSYLMLNGEEKQEMVTLFNEIGSDTDISEIQKLSISVANLSGILEQRKQHNNSRKGFYESIFTLAGAAVSIVLL